LVISPSSNAEFQKQNLDLRPLDLALNKTFA